MSIVPGICSMHLLVGLPKKVKLLNATFTMIPRVFNLIGKFTALSCAKLDLYHPFDIMCYTSYIVFSF